MSYDDFHNAVDTLVRLNLENRHKLDKDMRLRLGVTHLAMEFHTVRCDIGRRSGKSEYIKRRAKHGDLIVVARDPMKTIYRDAQAEVLSAAEISEDTTAEFSLDRVFIDEPRLVAEVSNLAHLYSVLARENSRQVFILLGT